MIDGHPCPGEHLNQVPLCSRCQEGQGKHKDDLKTVAQAREGKFVRPVDARPNAPQFDPIRHTEPTRLINYLSISIFYSSTHVFFKLRKLAETRISGVPSGNMIF